VIFNNHNEALQFVFDISSRVHWKTKLETDIINVLPINLYQQIEKFDFFWLYCEDLDIYNQISFIGVHRYILITYNIELEIVFIREFYS